MLVHMRFVYIPCLSFCDNRSSMFTDLFLCYSNVTENVKLAQVWNEPLIFQLPSTFVSIKSKFCGATVTRDETPRNERRCCRWRRFLTVLVSIDRLFFESLRPRFSAHRFFSFRSRELLRSGYCRWCIVGNNPGKPVDGWTRGIVGRRNTQEERKRKRRFVLVAKSQQTGAEHGYST